MFTTQHNTTQHNTTQHNTTQHNTTHLVFRNQFVTALYILSFTFLVTSNLSAKTKVLFSPNGGCTKEITTQIDSSNKTIDIAMFSFTSDSIALALVRAKDKGVKIRVLLDKEQANSKYSQSRFLDSCGIAVRLDKHPSYMHNKIMVIDTVVVLTGSFNWSKSAEKRNDENLLVIDDKEIVNIYQKKLGYLWEDNE